MEIKLLFTICFIALVSTSTEAQNIPVSFTYSTTDIVSVNGSSATGHCSSVTINCDGTTTCTAPSSSVLFDRHIPTLTGLDGDMWASQLLTLQPTTGMAAKITFDFSNRLLRLELVMFNCPQKGTAVQNIRLLGHSELQTITPTISFCDSLVRICVSATSFVTSLSLEFFAPPGSEWVHLAELRFIGSGITCPPDIILTPSTPATTSTDGSSQTSSRTINISQSAESAPTTGASCSTSAVLASVITAILTALLTTTVFVLVQIAVCKCHPKSTPHGGAGTGTSTGWERQVYQQIDGVEGGGVAVSDPTYMEVGGGGGGGGGRGKIIKVKKNEAYQETTIAIRENEAYGTHH